MKSLLKNFTSFLAKKETSTRTFTYYVPSPPKRNTGYQEKEFDKVFEKHFGKNSNRKVLSITTEQQYDNEKSGLWIICLYEEKVLKNSSSSITSKDFKKPNNSENDEPLEIYYD